jgi:DNA-binding NtrC family response regulator
MEHSDKTGQPAAAAFEQLIGRSARHQAMLEQLLRIVEVDAPTLIEGETGTGKELAARAIHYGGRRHAAPFVPVNCGALPDTLLESELFGAERGAYTDARQPRHGLVAEADNGTLFLDEVDALSARAQVALLRFLQDQRYRPLGSARERRSDVRVIAASNRSVEELVAQKEFRADLLYRLDILHLAMPPLREREGDAEILAEHFIALLARKYGQPAPLLHPATRAWMRQYGWPGNVRELENWVHRRVLARDDGLLTHGEAGAPPAADAGRICSFAHAKAAALRRFERDYLSSVLDEAGGNVTRAARLAGKERRAFGKLMKKHGVTAGRSAR